MTHPRRLRLAPMVVFALTLSGCGPLGFLGAFGPSTAVTPAVLTATAERTITAEAISEHVHFLASDEMRGRDTPSPELERAAAYLAEHFEASGLEPLGDDGGYLQRWPFQRLELDRAQSTAGAVTDQGERRWIYAEEYFAIPSPSTMAQGAPVFASSPAVVAQGLPPEVSTRPLIVLLPDGLGEDFGLVLQAALGARASGVVLVMDEDADASEIHQIAAALEAGAAGQLPIPVIGLRYDVGMEFLQSVGVTPVAGPAQMLLGANVSIRSTFEFQSDDVPNVVGVLRGSDPELADSYVILSAHYDHVGVGPPDATGDSIYSGADDNASGTAVLVQVAAAFAELPRAPPRSIVFLAVSGEEKGLLGSSHFATSRAVPVPGMIANLNMDMVGRNHPDTLYAIGDAFTTIGAMAYRIVEERPELGLILAPDPEPEEQAFLRSDHYSFVEVGVPALMLTTWLHDDYHVPSDTPDRVDADKAARVARLIFYLTHEIASDMERPDWTPEGRALLESISSF